MKRNLKALGLAMVAVFALSAVAASAAQAANNAHHFTVGTAPAIVTAEDEAAEPTVFKITNGAHRVECGIARYDATVTAKTNAELTITPTYSECKVDGSITAEVHVNHCAYVLENKTVNGDAGVEVECAAGNEITITYKIFGEQCIVHVTPQTPSGGAHYEQKEVGGIKVITAKFTVTGIKYHETRPEGGFLCPKTETGNDGTLSGSVTAKAYVDENTAGCEQAASGTDRTTPPSEATTTGCEGAAQHLILEEDVTELP